LPWVDATTELADSQQFIEHGLRLFADRIGAHVAIWACGELAGVLGLDPVNWANRSASLGYWLGLATASQHVGSATQIIVYCIHGIARAHRRCSKGTGCPPGHTTTLGTRRQDRTSGTHSWGQASLRPSQAETAWPTQGTVDPYNDCLCAGIHQRPKRRSRPSSSVVGELLCGPRVDL